jgi:hypothetical protein
MHQKVCNQFETQKQTTNPIILCVCAAEFSLPTYKLDQQTTNQFMCDLCADIQARPWAYKSRRDVAKGGLRKWLL